MRKSPMKARGTRAEVMHGNASTRFRRAKNNRITSAKWVRRQAKETRVRANLISFELAISFCK